MIRINVIEDPDSGFVKLTLPQAPNPDTYLKNIKYGIFYLCCFLLIIPTFLLLDIFWIEGFAWEIHIPSNIFLFIGFFFLLKQLARYKQDPVPERLTLKTDTIEYDSGVPVLQFKWPRTNGVDFGNRFYHNRINTEYQLSEIKSLIMRTQWQKQRLFITQNNKRREIGLDLSSYEREWLLDYITSRHDNN